MPRAYRPPFPQIIRATFEARPNRFLVLCRLPGGERVRAFLPNPGRLQELLLPGAGVYIVPAALSATRKTTFTMVGVDAGDRPIFLHTHVNNDVARHLLEHDLVPGLEGAQIVRAEVPMGHSRFDFLLEVGGKPIYLEVKSCTLFGNRVAMFPDAVTARGRRHLEELAALASEGIRTAVLFIIHSGRVDWFMPDFHTDPDFSRTLLEVKDRVDIIPMSVSWGRDFRLGNIVRRVPIPWEHVARELGNRGNYLILCRESTRANGKAFHLFAGWCPDQLFAFLRRAAKPRAGADWQFLEGFALVASRDFESQIVRAFAQQCDEPGEGQLFLDSEATHIGSSTLDPRRAPAFHALLAKFRMARPTRPNLGQG